MRIAIVVSIILTISAHTAPLSNAAQRWANEAHFADGEFGPAGEGTWKQVSGKENEAVTDPRWIRVQVDREFGVIVVSDVVEIGGEGRVPTISVRSSLYKIVRYKKDEVLSREEGIVRRAIRIDRRRKLIEMSEREADGTRSVYLLTQVKS